MVNFDGSFIMRDVDEPGDIDVLLILPASWDFFKDLSPFEDQKVMISNELQLKAVQEQIQRLKSALASLEHEVQTTSDRQFQVLSEGYVDQIAELQMLVDAFETERRSASAKRTEATASR